MSELFNSFNIMEKKLIYFFLFSSINIEVVYV